MNKKGIADKFFTLLIVVIAIALILFILFVIINGNMKKKQLQTEMDLNVMDGFYTSRVLLNQEIEPKYMLYDAAITAVNTGDYETFKTKISLAINGLYPQEQAGHKWLIIINDKCFVATRYGETSSKTEVNTPTMTGTAGVPVKPMSFNECASSIIDNLPKITIPNPGGKNIMFLAKPYDELDSKKGRTYGYRAGLLKGYNPVGVSDRTAPDGMPLEKIENIPNIECNEEQTNVGKICYARPELVAQLRKLSAEELQPKEEKLIITQAFRTYEIQKNLYEQACRNKDECKTTCLTKNDCKYARNPDKLVNPSGHLDGTAVDAIIITKEGKNLNDRIGKDIVDAETIMCAYGFVRWRAETWHFEYGSNHWKSAEENRANGKTVCAFGTG